MREKKLIYKFKLVYIPAIQSGDPNAMSHLKYPSMDRPSVGLQLQQSSIVGSINDEASIEPNYQESIFDIAFWIGKNSYQII